MYRCGGRGIEEKRNTGVMMDGIAHAQVTTDQPVGGHGKGASATICGESRFLTSWVDPSSLEVQNKYDELTSGLRSLEDKIMACLDYVADFPYVLFVKAQMNIGGKVFVQNDTWLDPAEIIYAPAINCANRAFLLASLLRQEMPIRDVHVVFGNINLDGQDGHAWNRIAFKGTEYMLEPTAPRGHIRFFPLNHVSGETYEDIIYFNDSEVRAIPNRALREPLSACWNCIQWLSDYISQNYCCP